MTEKPNEIDQILAEVANMAEKVQIGLEYAPIPSALTPIVLSAQMTRAILLLAKQVQRIAERMDA